MMPLHTFGGVDRVRVVDEAHELRGKTGTIVQRRSAGTRAWVEMDEALPATLQNFTPAHERARHVILFPDECEAVSMTPARTS